MHAPQDPNSLPALKRQSPAPSSSLRSHQPRQPPYTQTAPVTTRALAPNTSAAQTSSFSARANNLEGYKPHAASFPSPSTGRGTPPTVNSPSTGEEDDTVFHATAASGHITTVAASAAATTTATAASARVDRLRELEAFILQRGGRRLEMSKRQKVARKTLTLLPVLYPSLSKVCEFLLRQHDDTADAMLRAEDNTVAALAAREKRLYEEFETFFEGKIRDLVKACHEADEKAKAAEAAAYKVRKERDTELAEAKVALLQRMNACEHTEDQFRDSRHLIASVFQTNEKLLLRVEQLESLLERHRIDVPPVSVELMAYKTSSDKTSSTSGGGEVAAPRALSTQVPVAFMAAAHDELVKSRLTLQEELLHSAFDDRSAYRLRIEGLVQENNAGANRIAELEERVKDLYMYIHEKRFLTRVNAQGEETAPLTPRPREVPLALQTELGIELRHSTANILTELSTVAINMKHQLNSALLRAQQLHTLATWLNEGSTPDGIGGRDGAVGMVLQEIEESSVIPIFPVSSWATVPHFLRTTIAPAVRNCFWTEAQAACVLHNFFSSYAQLRSGARWVRDDKMIAPRVYQLFEHCRVVLAPLDATKEAVAESEDAVPFGYTVSHFAREVLAKLSPQNTQAALPIVLPGTTTTRYPANPTTKKLETSTPPTEDGTTDAEGDADASVKSKDTPAAEEVNGKWQEAAPVIEMDWAQLTYNMWYAAMRYQQTQPLCKLFVQLIDGQMPITTFDAMGQVIARVQRLVDQLDGERSRRFTYARLVNGLVRWVADTDAQAVLGGVRAVVHCFQDYHTPLHGGSVGVLALFADETYCEHDVPRNSFAQNAGASRRASIAALAASSPVQTATTTINDLLRRRRVPLPGSLTIRELPQASRSAGSAGSLAQPPLGATALIRFLRFFVLHTVESVYTHIDAVLSPLVEESEVVAGLYLLSVPRAMTVLARMEDLKKQAALQAAALGGGGLGDNDSATASFDAVAQDPADTFTGARLVAEAADLLGVHGVARSFLELLESRKRAFQVKVAAEQQLSTRTVVAAVGGMAHFKESTHFPFRHTQAAAAASSEKLVPATTRTTGSVRGLSGGVARPSSRGATPSVKFAEDTRSEKSTGQQTTKGGGKKTKKKKKAGMNRSTSPSPSMERQQDKLTIAAESEKADKRADDGANEALSTAGGITAPVSDLNSTDSLIASEDGELVEWFGLRHRLRQVLPKLPSFLFQEDPFELEEARRAAESAARSAAEMEAHEAKKMAAASRQVLRATEEEAPRPVV